MTNAEKIENENRIVPDAITTVPRRFSDVQSTIAAAGVVTGGSTRVIDRALQR